MSEGTRYNLAQAFFRDTEITTDKFKTTRKIDTEEYTATNSHHPYAVAFGAESFDWEMSDIDPLYRKFFEEVIDYQKENPNDLGFFATYDFNEITGDLVEDDIYYDAYVTELSKENANNPFTVKGSALRVG